jgi:hypothetical protein
MKKSIFKPIIMGIFLGAFVFFTGPLLMIVLLLKFIFTPFGMGRMRYRHRAMYVNDFGAMRTAGFGFADKIRNMNEEEYSSFKSKMQERRQNSYCC